MGEPRGTRCVSTAGGSGNEVVVVIGGSKIVKN